MPNDAELIQIELQSKTDHELRLIGVPEVSSSPFHTIQPYCICGWIGREFGSGDYVAATARYREHKW